jgi:hypothetical protein
VVKSEKNNAMLNDASSCIIHEMQNVVIVQDDALDEVDEAGIQVLKQVWIDMVVKDDIQKHKNRRLARSVRQTYNIRSKDLTCPYESSIGM